MADRRRCDRRRRARLGGAEADVQEHERRHRDKRGAEGEVVADQRLLRGIADDEHQQQVEARHLRQRAFPREAKHDEQKAIDGRRAENGARGAHVAADRGCRQQHEAGKAPALNSPLRGLKAGFSSTRSRVAVHHPEASQSRCRAGRGQAVNREW